MKFVGRILTVAFCAALVVAPSSAATYDLRDAEVILTSGNSVIVREGSGASEYTVAGGATLTVAGAPTTLSGLKPGMLVSGSLTTAGAPAPMNLQELRNTGVVYTRGGNLIVSSDSPDLYFHFTGAGMGDRGVLLFRAGQIVPVNALMPGDRITATVITKLPPTQMSTEEFEGFVESEKHKPGTVRSVANTPKINRFAATVLMKPDDNSSSAPAAPITTHPVDVAAPDAPAPSAPASAAPTVSPAPAPPAPPAAHAPAPAAATARPKLLPKTGSARPGVALAGIGLLGIGAMLTLWRRLGAGS